MTGSVLQDTTATTYVETRGQTSYYQGVILEMLVDEVVFPDGTHTTREYVLHDDAVGILPVRLRNGDLEILLIKQYRHPRQTFYWEVPAGLRDIAGEDPLLCAQRELREEAQLEAKEWELLLSYASSPGCMVENLDLYVALDPVPMQTSLDFIAEAEEADLHKEWFKLEDVYTAIKKRDLRSPTLVCGVLALMLEKTRLIEKLQG